MKIAWVSLLLGGLNFGITISNCSLLVIESYMSVENPKNYIISLLSTSSLIGMTVGSLSGSVLSSKYGLKRIFIIVSSLSIFFSVVQCIYVQWWFLFIFRVFQGFCIGVITITVQPWDLQLISEERKKLAAGIFSACVTTGCTISSLLLFLIIPNHVLWILSFAITAVISLALVILQARLPQNVLSPSSNDEKIAQVDIHSNLLTTDSETTANKENTTKWSTLQVKQYQFSPVMEQLESKSTIKKHKRIMFAFASCMGASQQIVGINTVLIYASIILENLFTKSDSLTKSLSSLILSFTNLIFNIVAAFIVPRVNKKILFIISYILTSICLLVVGIFYTLVSNKQVSSKDNYILLIVLIMYLLFYQLGPGCSYFVIISEAYPPQHLTTYTGISYSFNWLFNIISVIIYPLIGAPTFFIYFAVSICIIIAIILLFPKEKQSGYNSLLNLDRI